MVQTLTDLREKSKTHPQEITEEESRFLDTNRKYLPAWLSEMTEEECWNVLSSAGRIERFPGLNYTSQKEVARFLGIPASLFDYFKTTCTVPFPSHQYPVDFPQIRPGILRQLVQEAAAKNGIRYTEAMVDYGRIYACIDDDPCRAVELGKIGEGWMKHPHRLGVRHKVVSGHGVIAIVLKVVAHHKLNSAVATEVYKKCRPFIESKNKPKQEDVQMSVLPAEPTDKPKLDPAQTLRQMFDAMLNLLDKQAEERGAEKLIQKLKEEGKL